MTTAKPARKRVSRLDHLIIKAAYDKAVSGPHLGCMIPGRPLATVDVVTRDLRCWADSWILDNAAGRLDFVNTYSESIEYERRALHGGVGIRGLLERPLPEHVKTELRRTIADLEKFVVTPGTRDAMLTCVRTFLDDLVVAPLTRVLAWANGGEAVTRRRDVRVVCWRCEHEWAGPADGRCPSSKCGASGEHESHVVIDMSEIRKAWLVELATTSRHLFLHLLETLGDDDVVATYGARFFPGTTFASAKRRARRDLDELVADDRLQTDLYNNHNVQREAFGGRDETRYRRWFLQERIDRIAAPGTLP